MNWPSHFEATLSTPPDASLVTPGVTLVDLFYLQSDQGQVILTAIGADDKGRLGAVFEPGFYTMPATLRQQIRVTLISRRSALRTIVANELHVMGSDANEQLAMAGLNDPVRMFGTLWCVLQCNEAGWHVHHAGQTGALFLGRMDVLSGFVLGFKRAWRDTDTGTRYVSHLMLPGAPVENIESGRGLMLVYPHLPAADHDNTALVENTAVMMRFVYELLSRLQADLRAAKSKLSLATGVLPVPNRKRLETELEADGYVINGDLAICKHRAPPPDAASMLSRIRTWATAWEQEKLTLPPQASPGDYARLCTLAVPKASDAFALAMQAAMHSRVKTMQPRRAAAVAESLAGANLPALREPAPARVSPAQPPVAASSALPDATPFFEDVQVVRSGKRQAVRLTLRPDRNGHKRAVSLYMPGFKAAKSNHRYPTHALDFGLSHDAARLDGGIVQSIPLLAAHSATGTCRLAYWGVDSESQVETLGEFSDASGLSLRGPRHVGVGENLGAAIQDFANQLQHARAVNGQMDVALAVFLTDASLENFQTVRSISKFLALDVDAGRIPVMRFLLIDIGGQCNPSQLKALENPSGLAGKVLSLWTCSVVQHPHEVAGAIAQWLQTRMPARLSPLRVMSPDGAVLLNHGRGISRLVQFGAYPGIQELIVVVDGRLYLLRLPTPGLR